MFNEVADNLLLVICYILLQESRLIHLFDAVIVIIIIIVFVLFCFCFDFVVDIVQLLFSAVLFIMVHNVRSMELWLAGL